LSWISALSSCFVDGHRRFLRSDGDRVDRFALLFRHFASNDARNRSLGMQSRAKSVDDRSKPSRSGRQIFDPSAKKSVFRAIVDVFRSIADGFRTIVDAFRAIAAALRRVIDALLGIADTFRAIPDVFRPVDDASRSIAEVSRPIAHVFRRIDEGSRRKNEPPHLCVLCPSAPTQR
jgi:hypothetical protein